MVLTLTRKTDYALVAMADMAHQHPSAVSARDISERLRMPLPAMQKILTRLMHRELVVSIRGPQGGYRLGRPPEKITLAELIDAVEGPFRLTPCSGPEPNRRRRGCRTKDVCPITGSMRKVHGLLERCLTEVTVAQLAFDTVPAALGLAAGPESGGDRGGRDARMTRRRASRPG